MSTKVERDFQIGDQVAYEPLTAGLPTTGKLISIESDPADQCVVQVRPTILAIVQLEQLVRVAREREQTFKVMSAP